VTWLVVCAAFLRGHELPASEPLDWTETDHTFNRYCYECHGGFATDADLDLIHIDHRADLEASPEKWMTILRSLRTHYMPHPDGRDMPAEARSKLVEKIRFELMRLAKDYDPASASLRRLNRTEFNNTFEDLFFVDVDFADSLPADDAGYGFDNIAAALSFSPLLLERYFDAAAELASIAVPLEMDEDHWSLAGTSFAGNGHSGGGVKWIYSSGGRNALRSKVYFPAKGAYEVEFKFSAAQAGDEDARAEVFFDDTSLGEIEVRARRGEAPDRASRVVAIETPGERPVEVRFLNDFYRKTDDKTEDRNLAFHGLEVKGPRQSKADLSSNFLEHHFGQDVEGLSLKELRDGIHRFASRAYRRPATAEETDALWQAFLANSNRGEEDWRMRDGLRAVIDAVVTSPSFLFRFEDGGPTARYDPFALAGWLSYFLWSSMPDDRLFDLARRGRLHAELEGEIRRMLQDPKAAALAENFAGQWWQTRDLSIHEPDPAVYEGADDTLLDAMREETRRFFVHVLEEDRPLPEILSADYTFLNERLARHYGIEGVKGKHFRKVSLEGTLRRGVWSQGGILTLTSYPNHTSPVLRGQWILENLIGLSPPPPPDNIPSLPGTDGKPDADDLRASLAIHRENSSCASCHDIMDPLGLALEHFDGVGGLRSLEERKRLSEETLFDGEVIRDPIDLARYFETKRSVDFLRNAARKLAIYASGRGLEWRDEAALDRMVAYTRGRGDRFSAMIEAAVNEFAPLPKDVSIASTHPAKDEKAVP